jgi:hypothetical protein
MLLSTVRLAMALGNMVVRDVVLGNVVLGVVVVCLLMLVMLVAMVLPASGSLLKGIEVGHVHSVSSRCMRGFNSILNEVGSRKICIGRCALCTLRLWAFALTLPLLAWRTGQSGEVRLIRYRICHDVRHNVWLSTGLARMNKMKPIVS